MITTNARYSREDVIRLSAAAASLAANLAEAAESLNRIGRPYTPTSYLASSRAKAAALAELFDLLGVRDD